ncbi:mannose-6-phosphate isomerase, class I [Kwoniella dejecticola CBS 10117]|uniref:Mannose-6-phosphate isomerase n=1 Tax=Kwoniella dejecticola CBS 10117 TaxID=1296121 RepID=A0A1A5ZV25_9TREE|nr:mannose-6-phosphate isomerase, class I [Kwoniella dejecticola CBS 10117]OBR81657.1 mannose-6-phosphate isomerase, class I [Kwoniella dejecticola CBS 10117]
MVRSIFKLSPGVQSYDWGKKGSASLAAQFGKASVDGFVIDEDKTYAELWMGTHPTLPSKLDDSTLLSDYIKSNNGLVGDKVIKKFEDSQHGNLPFLFKVLSIGTALSIQAHPDKTLARKLFDERPDVYKDPNHKPEMAIALTPFLAFLNFLPLPVLLLNLLIVPELQPIIPSALITQLGSSLTLPTTPSPDPFLYQPTVAPPSDEQKSILKQIFNALMSADKDTYTTAIRSLVERYKKGEDIHESEKGLVDLTLMLNDQYPDDIGILCVFFLNVVELKKGEAAFLEANSPHAYIKGDIIECMATSDNVVRAGLTPKLRDVSTLIEMLTYESGPGNKQLLKPINFNEQDDTSKLYDPPIAEFSVVKINLPAGGKTPHRKIEGPSIAIITQGKGSVSASSNEDEVDFERGQVIFIGADQEVQWEASEELEVFRAFVEA